MTSSRAARARAAPTTRRRSRRTERVPKLNDVVDIWWVVDKTFYRGRLDQQLDNDTSFRILYDDGETEDIDLVNEYWKFANDDKPPPTQSEHIVDVVVDGSHQQSKSQSTTKKPKSKSAKSSIPRPKPHQSSDDDNDEDYVEEEEHHQPTTRQKRPKTDPDKPKKRPKKARKHSVPSDKTSSASRPPPKTTAESRQTSQHLADQPQPTSPIDQVLPSQTPKSTTEATSPAQKTAVPANADSRHTPISRDEWTKALHKKQSDTQIVQVIPSRSVPNNATPSTFHIETPHMPKSQNIQKPSKTKTPSAEISQPRTTTNSISQLPTSAPSAGDQCLPDSVATSPQVTSAQHAPIVSQRDLAIIQAEPSFIPADRPGLPPSSDPTTARQTVVNNDTANSLAPYNKVKAVPPSSAPTATPAGPVNKNNVGGEMVQDLTEDQGPTPSSVGAKLPSHPKSGPSHQGRVHGDSSTDHSGFAATSNAAAVHDNDAGRKRAREDDNSTAARVNGDVRRKRSKTGSAEGERDLQTEGVIPLTHFPEHDSTLATLVNRRLNPIEKHIRSLSEDMRLLTSDQPAQRKINETISESMQRLEQDMRKEVRAIRDEWRLAQSDRQEKQQEILRLMQEVRESLARGPPSHPAGHTVAALTVQRSSPPNGYNVRAPGYQRSTPAHVRPTTSAVPQITDRRIPPQEARPVRAPLPEARPVRVPLPEARPVRAPLPEARPVRAPLPEARPVRAPLPRNPVEMPATVNSDEDVNVSPRRVAAPMPNAARAATDMNSTKVTQLPSSGPKFKVTSVVARQITVWLLETPHEYDPGEGVSQDLWARRTSAGAFERVADRLSHFESYAQAYQTLSTSLGNDAVEMSWFMRPHEHDNIMRARRNYAAWDPPPTDSEWESECVLLIEIANGFHRALHDHVWRKEDDLTAAVVITKNAGAWYATGRPAAGRQVGSGEHVAVSQPHRADHATNQSGTQFIHRTR